jgi:hypothetical protein
MKEHPEDLEMLKQEELVQSQCSICFGLPLPVNFKETLTVEMMAHVTKYHLPLQCNKCLKRFETIDDFSMIGKCCKEKEEPEQTMEISKENMGDSVNIPDIKIDEASVKKDDEDKQMTPTAQMQARFQRKNREFGKVAKDDEDKQMTPTAQMQARFQRKNREFGKVAKNEEEKETATLSKKTSTPLATNIDSPLAMHMSSINYISSSSETDFSPPASAAMPAPKKPKLTPGRFRLKIVIKSNR